MLYVVAGNAVNNVSWLGAVVVARKFATDHETLLEW